jgi:hypothetical protein
VKKFILGLGVLIFFSPGLLRAEDLRRPPLDINIIIDGSSALQNGREGALNWLCSRIIDETAAEGDRLSVWLAGGRAERVYSDRINGETSKESVKALLKSLNLEDADPLQADFIGALQEAASRISGETAAQQTYTVLISGSAASLSLALKNDKTGLLRFSKIEEFSGWRKLVIALGIAPQVQRAAAAYMNMGVSGNPGWVPRDASEKIANSL